MHSEHNLKFICDRDLGRLAKWLRIMGFDSIYMKNMNENIIDNQCLLGRVILTRSERLSEKRELLLISSDNVKEQIKEVNSRYPLKAHLKPFSRCSICNELLEPATPEDARESVPEYIVGTAVIINKCPSCKKYYWPGSHQNKIDSAIKNMLE